MNNEVLIKLQAEAFRGLVQHLQNRTDVQNIDLMNLAGFCRNCLSKWILQAANGLNCELSYEQAQEIVYGMPYSKWKEMYQHEASAEQLKSFESTKPLHAVIGGKK